ncbi:MAG TPA: peptide deformylase [Thermoanaerobaculia bacterium]
MSVRPIRLFPDEVLRVRCEPVDRFDGELATLVADLVETMHAAPGVGLAAPQVGVTKRVFVVDLSVGEDPAQVHVFVNPRLVEEEGQVADFEGCLSIPDLSEKVERPERVVVEAQDVDGETFRLEAAEWLARAICHENDHLDGVLFVDRLRGLRREKARRQLKKMLREREEVPA